MVLTDINDCGRYECLHPGFRAVFDFIRTADFNVLPAGAVPLSGGMVANHVRVQGKELSGQCLEAHRKYIDIHYLIDGDEIFGWLPLGQVAHWISSYDVASDSALSDSAPSTYISLSPGDMAIVWPEDAHAPLISSGTVHKLVVKIPLE